MSQIDKLKHSFRDCRSTFRYCDFERLLGAAGFEKIKAGATGGSRRKFMHQTTQMMIWLDEPHDGEMKPSMVRRLRDQLKGMGLI
jgi:hypothetical protein